MPQEADNRSGQFEARSDGLLVCASAKINLALLVAGSARTATMNSKPSWPRSTGWMNCFFSRAAAKVLI